MQKIIINFIENPKNQKISSYYKEAFFDLFQNFWVKVYCFIYQWNAQLTEINKTYNDFWIYFDSFDNFEIFKNKTSMFQILEITTFTESLIQQSIEYKKNLWMSYTKNEKLFRDKKLQRELLLHYEKDISVNYKKFSSISSIDIEQLEKEFKYPFIIKPIAWIQSQLVYKVENREVFSKAVISFLKADKKHFNALNSSDTEIEVLVEEFIDGEMYSLNYYVDWNGKIYPSKIVKVLSWQELGVDDFFNYNRLAWEFIEKELENYDVLWFIQKNIEATWIRWSYIHHEFKLNSKWELKTIELNGRIWWYRLEMMKEETWFNILRFMLWEKMPENIPLTHVAFFVFYAHKRAQLKWFNTLLIEKVKTLPSFLYINLVEKNIWKETGLTKQWFPKNMIIKLKNENFDMFNKDVKFIENNYFDFLILDENYDIIT